MRRSSATNRRRTESGNVLIEFALVALLLFVVLFAIFEFSRLALVYSGVANSARAGARYAIVHGAYRSGSGVSGPSGPAANPPEVLNVVRAFASAAPVDTTRLNITVTYVDGSNQPGNRVTVAVEYPYDPWVMLPLYVTLRTTSQGVITF